MISGRVHLRELLRELLESCRVVLSAVLAVLSYNLPSLRERIYSVSDLAPLGVIPERVNPKYIDSMLVCT